MSLASRQLEGPNPTLPPPIEESLAKNIVKGKHGIEWTSIPGQKTSQTNILLNSGVGLNKKFIYSKNVKVPIIRSRSEAMMGSSDIHPTSVLPTVNQKTASGLVEFPTKAFWLINPEQNPNVSTTYPPASRKGNPDGPSKFKSSSTDQSDIGYNDIDDPNPHEGLPPLDPVEAQGTIQPFRYDGQNLIMPSTGYKRYLAKNQEAGKSRYRKLPKGVNHDQTAMVATSVSNYLWQDQRDSARLYQNKKWRDIED